MGKNKEVFLKAKKAHETYEACKKATEADGAEAEVWQRYADAVQALADVAKEIAEIEGGEHDEGEDEGIAEGEDVCPVCKGHGAVPKIAAGTEGEEVTEAGVKKTAEALAIINPSMAKHFTECHAVAKGVKATEAHRKLAESIRNEFIVAGVVTKESAPSIDELAGLANGDLMRARITAKSMVSMRESVVAPSGMPVGGFGASFGFGAGKGSATLTNADLQKADLIKKKYGGK